MNIAVIGDQDMVEGFGLAGLKNTCTVGSVHETEAALAAFLRDPAIGVIIIQESYADRVRPAVRAAGKEPFPSPVIVAVPGKDETGHGEETVRELLQTAVGRVVRVGEEEP
jgi:V/A-type H+-transporting ATPase subunit F